MRNKNLTSESLLASFYVEGPVTYTDERVVNSTDGTVENVSDSIKTNDKFV